MSQPQVNRHDVLEPEYTPDNIVNREEILDQLSSVLSEPGTNIHLYGPRGCGKTLTTRRALENVSQISDYHLLDCTRHDTQYKILIELAETLEGKELASGYHSAQLQDLVAESIANRRLILVLDEIDFLLENDASDLLYFLTRLNHDELNIVTISANNPDLSEAIEERTHSTLSPRTLRIEPYSITETYKILEHRARTALGRDRSLPKDALSTIALSTANLHLALHWLKTIAEQQGEITESLVAELRPPAVKRYRAHLLNAFTPHHRLLCEVVQELTTDAKLVHTGAIYDQYEAACQAAEIDPLTSRRISDFLKHLELLGIIQADYHYGGKEGKTREIQLQQF